ncbi:cystine transport system substrate-binding protein [Kineococcus xinjiangensis]|uniref:Cystine transport system substrate-binding protein n=1 Tax=Kineococcus xinjiangensis TaxID=512762 RepID=A0A2S6IE02_9ACTN|nr:amino acid ABC transporter substrate-binding protein [Kineococcus xinjiangensis]PPK92413.1 cystine transport system substrate-binding protein [Kineococcus xinjiangensis]
MGRRIFGIASALTLAGLLAACGGTGAGGDGAGGSEEVLRVGTEGTYAPFTFHDESTNELTGYDVEVVNAVADKLGRKVEYSENAWDSLFAGLEAKRYDVVANQVSVTEERKGKYAFSEPYTVSTGVIATRADDDSVSGLADLQGKRAAQSATSNWAQVAKDAGAEVEAVEGLTQAVTLLKQGRVDLTLNDNLTILEYLKSTGDDSIKIAAETDESTEQAFAFRKEDAELAAEFDEALAELRADGTLAKISEKWFGEDVSGPVAG